MCNLTNIKKNSVIAVIDGNSWLHRAYHAVPPTISLPDGTPTNAIHGFLNMLISFINNTKPDGIICAFDAGIPEFRLAAVSSYKAQRKPMDNELRVQFPIIEEILKSMNIPVIKEKGWEGDDILGTVSKLATKEKHDCLLVTGDKDVNQLASNNVKIVNMKKGVSSVVLLGPDEIFEKYGIYVDQFVDYLALMGDSSDNIPGVAGIGPKSAVKLLSQFGNLEGIYDNLDKLKGKQLQNLIDNKQSAFISRTAATICCDVPIEIDFNNCIFPNFNLDTMLHVFMKYRLKTSLKNLFKIADKKIDLDDLNYQDSITSNDLDNDFDEPKLNYINFLENKEAEDFVDHLLLQNSKLAIAVDYIEKEPLQVSLYDNISSQNLDELDCVSCLLLAVGTNLQTAIFHGQKAACYLKKILLWKNSNKIICENSKSVLSAFFKYNKSYNLSNIEEQLNNDIDDIGIAAYVLDSSKQSYSADDVYSQIYYHVLDTCDLPEKNVIKCDSYISKKNNLLKLRLSKRAAITYSIFEPLIKLLARHKVDYVYNSIDKPLVPILLDMENTGVRIDNIKLQELSHSTADLLDGLKNDIYEIAGEEFNIDSPKQLSHILFDVLGLPAKKKTKTGYSTNASILEELSTLHQLPKLVILYREYSKIKSSYIDVLPTLEDSNDLIHTCFHQKRTATGRLSSSNPNIQSIPTRTEFGNQIRQCFVPLRDDEVFVCADYSQIELRLLAHLSNDRGLVDAFNKGVDFHSATASDIFDVDIKCVTKEQRRIAKAVNFGIIYGQQAYGLSSTLHIDISEASDIIQKYFATYPDVKKYLEDVVNKAKLDGYSQTMFNRRRYIPELKLNKRLAAFGQRTAMNHPMQGSAADIIKLAMKSVISAIGKANIKAKCMIQVHDELDFSVRESDVSKLCELVKEKMENVVNLSVPLVVDISYGSTWADAK